MNHKFNATNLQILRILKKKNHYYIDDDKTHDSLFVQYVFTLHWSYFKNQGCFPKQQMVWSNGCPTQLNGPRLQTICPLLTSCVQEIIFLTKDSIRCLTRTPSGYPTF